MVVGDYGYRKVVAIGADMDALAEITILRFNVERPDGTQFTRDLTQADRDADGNFTWLLQAGEVTMPGFYKCQAVDMTTGRQVGTYTSKFEVKALL
jgi:hypothetical protein